MLLLLSRFSRVRLYAGPRPWDFPGKSTGVGCHCLLHPRHYTWALLTGSPVKWKERDRGRKCSSGCRWEETTGKEAFLGGSARGKGGKEGFCGVVLGRMDFFWGGGGWILEQCFDVERIVQCFFFLI